jgi:predicted CXXCH cytochrome family protein
LLAAQGPDLCQNCHTGLKDKIRKETVHSPARKDCLTCHAPHFSKEAVLAKQPLLKLCGECHNLATPSFGKSHIGIDPAAMRCMTCHDPHSSKDPKLYKEKMHPPFASGSCEECHIVGKK